MADLSDLQLSPITPRQFIWLHHQGVSAKLLVSLYPIMSCVGRSASDGRFEPGEGDIHLVFEEPEDLIFWHPRTSALSSLNGRAFALNEDRIWQAATYSLDGNLNIFETALDWLQAGCDGIVVIDWLRAFDKLRDAPRIAVAEKLLPQYRGSMRPSRMPALSIIPTSERQAA